MLNHAEQRTTGDLLRDSRNLRAEAARTVEENTTVDREITEHQKTTQRSTR